jgi:hypothetical protein
MFSHLLSKLPAPRVADWRIWKVSICLSLLFENSKKIVNISDQKVNFGDFSADNLALKDLPIYKDMFVLFAGNDVEHAMPIIERARDIVYASKSAISVRDAAYALDQAYCERLHDEITRRVLRKRGFDVESFREKGKQKCTPSSYLNLCSRIDQVSISLKFLVVGFGPTNATGHIYLVDGESAPKNYDAIGMYAIGAGAIAAVSSLAFHAERLQVNPYAEEERALYFALTAKFMAESSGDVGRGETFVTIIEKGKPTRYPTHNFTETVRSLWEKDGAPRVPKNLDATMKELIAKECNLSEGQNGTDISLV